MNEPFREGHTSYIFILIIYYARQKAQDTAAFFQAAIKYDGHRH